MNSYSKYISLISFALALTLCFQVPSLAHNTAHPEIANSADIEISKEEAECDAFREAIENKYTLPAVALSLKGKHDEAIALYRAALTKVRESSLTSQWARDASLFDKHALHEYIASEYRAMGKYDLAAQTVMENYKEQKDLGHLNPGLLTAAGEDYQKANMEKEAEAAFGEALKVAAETPKAMEEHESKPFNQAEAQAAAEKEYARKKILLLKTHYMLRQAKIAMKEVYRLQGEKDKMAEIDAELADKHCPICGSDESVEPIATAAAAAPEAPKKRAKMSDSTVRPDGPSWRCTKDDVEF